MGPASRAAQGARVSRWTRLPRGFARQDPDPVMQELYRFIAYHESTPPGSLIEISCQRCPETYRGTSPRQLASKMYEHIRSRHPEARLDPIER
jgi:hypothetical protein